MVPYVSLQYFFDCCKLNYYNIILKLGRITAILVTNTLGVSLEMQRAGQVEAVSNFMPGLIWGNVLIWEQDISPRPCNHSMTSMWPSYTMKTYLAQRLLEVTDPVSHPQKKTLYTSSLAYTIRTVQKDAQPFKQHAVHEAALFVQQFFPSEQKLHL